MKVNKKHRIPVFFIYRCVHPAQQHGRRIPPDIFEIAFSIRIVRVSANFPDVTQQIHSLRASGVISCQSASTFDDTEIACLKSAGNLWMVPDEIVFVVILLF